MEKVFLHRYKKNGKPMALRPVYCKFHRFCSYRLIISEDELFEYELKVSITTAKAQNDKLWLLALKNLKKERKARDK